MSPGGRQNPKANDHGNSGLSEKPTEPFGRIREYRLLEQIGQGGMGTVYKASHTMLERLVAIKLLPTERMNDEQSVLRFRQEMKAVGKVQHPNIVQAYDAGEERGIHYLVMEYVDGVDVSWLQKQLGELRVPDACEIIRQAALGLEHAHQHGLVHRDIKPSNLLLASTGEVKVLDLGLALLQRDQTLGRELTATGQIMGTFDYMAPEQADDTHKVDIRADLYSLGCTLYKLLCTHAPFSGPEYDSVAKKTLGHALKQPTPIRELRPDVPEPLADILNRLLAKEPANRYGTPAELAEAIRPFAEGHHLAKLARKAGGKPRASGPVPESLRSTEVYVSDTPGDTARAAVPSRRLLPAAVAIALIVVVVVMGAFLQSWRQPTGRSTDPRAGEYASGAVSQGVAPQAPAAGDPAESAGQAVAGRPLKIEELRLIQYRGEQARRIGEIGGESKRATEDDDVRAYVRLSEPAYCYLLALNPDGAVQLCFPQVEDAVPQPTAELDFPNDVRGYFGLTDGPGQQAFVVVASRDPLPCFAEWQSRIDGLPWKVSSEEGVWHYTDRELYSLGATERGDVRRRESAKTFSSSCEFLGSLPGVDGIRAVAFPVVPKGD